MSLNQVKTQVHVKNDLYLSINVYKGKTYVDLRRFFEPKKKPGQKKPTRKGVAMDPVEWKALEQLFLSPDMIERFNIKN